MPITALVAASEGLRRTTVDVSVVDVEVAVVLAGEASTSEKRGRSVSRDENGMCIVYLLLILLRLDYLS